MPLELPEDCCKGCSEEHTCKTRVPDEYKLCWYIESGLYAKDRRKLVNESE